MKTRKSFSKRFKITKTGKVLRRAIGQDHLLSKNNGNATRKLRKLVRISGWEAKKIKKLIKR